MTGTGDGQRPKATQAECAPGRQTLFSFFAALIILMPFHVSRKDARLVQGTVLRPLPKHRSPGSQVARGSLRHTHAVTISARVSA